MLSTQCGVLIGICFSSEHQLQGKFVSALEARVLKVWQNTLLIQNLLFTQNTLLAHSTFPSAAYSAYCISASILSKQCFSAASVHLQSTAHPQLNTPLSTHYSLDNLQLFVWQLEHGWDAERRDYRQLLQTSSHQSTQIELLQVSLAAQPVTCTILAAQPLVSRTAAFTHDSV